MQTFPLTRYVHHISDNKMSQLQCDFQISLQNFPGIWFWLLLSAFRAHSEGVTAKVIPQCSFCLILFPPYSDHWLMPCLVAVDTIPPTRGKTSVWLFENFQTFRYLLSTKCRHPFSKTFSRARRGAHLENISCLLLFNRLPFDFSNDKTRKPLNTWWVLNY